MLNVQRIAWPLIVVLVLSAGAVWHVATAQEKKVPATPVANQPVVQRWEYMAIAVHGLSDGESEKTLNKFGMDGWELVAVAQEGNRVFAYLKRRK